jgi:hypothetical protein
VIWRGIANRAGKTRTYPAGLSTLLLRLVVPAEDLNAQGAAGSSESTFAVLQQIQSIRIALILQERGPAEVSPGAGSVRRAASIGDGRSCPASGF